MVGLHMLLHFLSSILQLLPNVATKWSLHFFIATNVLHTNAAFV